MRSKAARMCRIRTRIRLHGNYTQVGEKILLPSTEGRALSFDFFRRFRCRCERTYAGPAAFGKLLLLLLAKSIERRTLARFPPLAITLLSRALFPVGGKQQAAHSDTHRTLRDALRSAE